MSNLSMKIDDETHLALKIMAANKRTSITALVGEGIELLFAMHGGKGAGKAKGRGLVREKGDKK